MLDRYEKAMEKALRSYTQEAAYGSFHEDKLGSIETGKAADITVLPKVITVPEDEILSTEVTFTIVDGKVHYEKSKAMIP